MEKISKIETSRITANKSNPRTRIDNVDDLVSSIKENGLLQPITVRWNKEFDAEGIPTGYEVIAGSRRLTACKKLGIEKMDCIVLNVTEEKALELATVENIVRENMNAVDEANAVSKLYEQGKGKHEIAAIFGKSVRWAEGRRKIVGLGDKAMEMLASGKINLGHAEVLTMCPPERVERYLDFAGWNTPEQLKSKILSDRHELTDAPFDFKKICKNCENRSDNQQDLFGDVKECYCLNEECYKNQTEKECHRKIASFEKAGYSEVPEQDYGAARYATNEKSRYRSWNHYFSIEANDEESNEMVKKIKANGGKARWWLDRETAESGLVWFTGDAQQEPAETEEEREERIAATAKEKRIEAKANELEREQIRQIVEVSINDIHKDTIAILFDFINSQNYDEETFGTVSANAEDSNEEEYNEGAVANIDEKTSSGMTQREFVIENIVKEFMTWNGCKFKSEAERNFFALESREKYMQMAKEIVESEPEETEDEGEDDEE